MHELLFIVSKFAKQMSKFFSLNATCRVVIELLCLIRKL